MSELMHLLNWRCKYYADNGEKKKKKGKDKKKKNNIKMNDEVKVWILKYGIAKANHYKRSSIYFCFFVTILFCSLLALCPSFICRSDDHLFSLLIYSIILKQIKCHDSDITLSIIRELLKCVESLWRCKL